jgi:hypothetical protein
MPLTGTIEVRLTQTRRMKGSLDADSWMAFTATQMISTRTCEFDWREKAGPLGMIAGRNALMSGVERFAWYWGFCRSFAHNVPQSSCAAS